MKVMCDKCYNIINLGNIDIDLSPQVIPGTNNALLTKGVAVNCERCPNESANIVLDDNIAEVISLLNKKGYMTYGCCEGHEEKDSLYIVMAQYAELRQLYHYFIDLGHDITLEYIPITKMRIEIKYKSISEKKEIISNLMKWVTESLEFNYLGFDAHVAKFHKWLRQNPEYQELNDTFYHMYWKDNTLLDPMDIYKDTNSKTFD